MCMYHFVLFLSQYERNTESIKKNIQRKNLYLYFFEFVPVIKIHFFFSAYKVYLSTFLLFNIKIEVHFVLWELQSDSIAMCNNFILYYETDIKLEIF